MIYIASPYSYDDPSKERVYWKLYFRYHCVMKYCAHLINEGKIPFSPIVYAHEMAQRFALPTDAAWWSTFNEDIMRRCDSLHVYHMDGWKTSKGVAAEMNYAENCGITIVHVPVLQV